MRAYLCVTALTFCLPLLAACAADENNPLKNARVGDYATYKLTITFEGDDTSGQITHTVTARSDKEVVITRSGQIKSQQVPPGEEQKIDLTKPYDPMKFAGVSRNYSDVKIEKLKEGKEKVKVGDKEYDATWTIYRLKGKVVTGLDVHGTKVDFTSEFKVWMSKDFALGPIKTETTANLLNKKVEMMIELIESGNKPLKK